MKKSYLMTCDAINALENISTKADQAAGVAGLLSIATLNAVDLRDNELKNAALLLRDYTANISNELNKVIDISIQEQYKALNIKH